MNSPLHSTPQQVDPLADSETYRALIKHIPQGYCIIDVLFDDQQQPFDYRFLEVNPLFEQLTGLVDAVGKTMRQLQPAHEQHWFELYGQVVKTGQSVQVEQQAAHLAGGGWYDVFAFPLGATQPHQVGVFFTDQSERKQREQQQAFLLRFSDRLRAQPNPDAVATCALELLLNQLGLDRCYIGVYRLDEDRGDFTHQVGNERVPPVPDRVRLSDFPDALRVAFERTLVIDDVSQAAGLTDRDRQNLGALGFGALVAATLRLGANHPLWAIIAISARPRRWSPAEINLIEEITERTWAALERAKAEEILQQAETTYRTQLEAQVARRTAELAASQQLVQATLDSSPALIQVFEAVRSPAGEIVDFVWTLLNPAAERLFTNLIGQRLRQQHPDVGATGIFDLFKRVVETGISNQSERHYVHEPLKGWFYESAVKLGDGVATTTTDITARKQAEEALLEADRRKDEFLAMLAHELRNPLAPVRNGLQLLAQTHADDPVLSTLLPVLNRQMDHLLRLVDDLLDVSRIRRGRIELRKGPLDLIQVVGQAIDALQPLYRGSARQLHTGLPSVPLQIEGDATRIHQVVTNLLTNGLRYTRAGGQVWLTLERVGDQAVLRVRDNGIGLTADQLDAIFELFVQVDTSLARSHGGLGVGLTLVKELVHLHGGRIEAQSAGLEQGSEFSVYLPILLTQPI